MFDANLWYQFLPKLLNMSLTASVVILCVLLARLCLRRQPRILSYALWAVVLFRLLCPVSVSSDFSVFRLFDSPVTEVGTVTTVLEYVPENLVHTAYPAVSLPVVGDRVNTAINDALPAGAEQLAADPLEAPVSIATIVWGMGVLGMLLYSGISLYSLRRRLVGSTPLEGRVLLCDHIDSPFVLGLIRPRIYLPSGLSESERGYILLHERTHIRRGDHIVKLLAFAALTVHWFNPLVWAAFVLLGQDMEMSCDEAVIRSLGDGVRADYSQSLLRLATGRRLIAGTPLAFGEGDTKGRIRNILRGRRTRWWLVSAGVLLVCTVIAVCVFNPSSPTDPAQVTGAYDASTLGGDFLRAGNPAYAVGSNAYGRPVFVDAGAAFEAFTAEYADAVAYIREANSLAPLTRRNYDMYKVLGFQTTSDDETLAARCREVSQFLDLYENSFIAEGSVSAATPTRPAADGIYAGDAFLAQHGGLSFEPPDGKFFAEILIEGNLLEVADREGNLLFSGENVGRQSVSREELIDRMSEMYLYAPGVGQLDQKTLEDFVPHYDGLDMEICTWYSPDTASGEIAYIIYCFKGVPTWFVTGENLRFFSMIPAPTASDLTEAAPETSASQSQPVATQPAVADPSVDPTIDGLIIPEHQIDTAILRRYAPATPDGRLHVESHMILDARERRHPITGSREITYYMLVSHNSYSTYDGELTEVGGSSMIPTALRFEVDNANNFTLIEYWEPRGGAGFDDDVRDVFPEDAAEDALHLQGEGAILSSENYNKALLMLVSSATIDVEIADRLNTICSYPTASSNPGAYIDAHPEEYELLLGYGEYTLRYCFSQFLPGGQTGLRGHIMASLMQDIMERWGEEVPLAWKCPVGEEWASDPSRLTAQGWFDDFLHQSLTLRDQLSAEEFEKHHPVKAMLLEMTDNT